MNLKELRTDFENHVNNVSNEKFVDELIQAGILKPVYDCYPFKNMSKWEKIKLWVQADVPYFFKNLWWKFTKKY